MEKDKKYPIGAEHYSLYEKVGKGASATVHRALCTPLNEIVAIKILDFECSNCDLNNISREVQTMVLVDHPNVLKSHCSFISDHNLWVVMPYMSGGSCLQILKSAHPDGFEEVVIATILREVLKGLDYLHQHGHIHRDVKAGNILIDPRGRIKLGDFGVSACLFDSGDRQRTRNTFVGTPCWMAPEVMEQLHGYDFKADIWSFGITALELAHGHAPFSKYPPMKVLLITLQNAPPGLDYERDKKFSKSFKQMIASCLVKDPSKRPSAKMLLKHSFFKQARSNDYIARTLLEGLPALGDRLKALKIKEQDMLAQKEMADGEKEEISQNEYKRGISSWNFDIEDMKAQASLIQDDDVIAEKDEDMEDKQLQCQYSFSKQFSRLQHQSSFGSQHSETADSDDNVQSPHSCVNSTTNIVKNEKSEVDGNHTGSTIDQETPNISHGEECNLAEKSPLKVDIKSSDGVSTNSNQSCRFQNQSLNSNGGGTRNMQTLAKTSANGDEVDEKQKSPVIQQKGRFKVTSENLELEKVVPSPMLPKSHSVQDGILNLRKQSAGNNSTEMGCAPMNVDVKEKSLVAHDREKELLSEIADLQWRLSCVQEELRKYKIENAQMNP